MRKNEKSTYLIIALVCLIILNLGSMTIVLGKNTRPIDEDRISLISRIKSGFNLGSLFREVMGRSLEDKDRYDSDDEDDDRNIGDDDFEILDDFIIIDSLDELENLIMVKDSEGKHIVENIPEMLNIKKIKVNKDKPYILMYHTHATEAFSTHKKNDFRTKDDKENMNSIGEIVAKVLEAGGHKVLHNKTQHDNPSYNQSYSRSLNTVNKAMEAEKNLKIILDLHRDSRRTTPDNHDRVVAQTKVRIDGKDIPKFSLVIGAMTPNYNEVLNWAKYIKAVSDEIYPGFCSGIIIKKYSKFNQFVSDYSALLEMGFDFHNHDEIKETAKLVGEILDISIRSIEE